MIMMILVEEEISVFHSQGAAAFRSDTLYGHYTTSDILLYFST